MKILVTGGSGMVGKHLKELLPDAFYVGSKDYDLTIPFGVRSMFSTYEPDVVIHLAAKVGGIQDNIANPLEFLESNLVMNTNVVTEAQKHRVKKFIGIGSTCVYPDQLPDDSYPLTEDLLHAGPPTPTNFGYGYAKRMLAVHLETIRKARGFDYFTIFPSNLYSEYDHFDDDTKAHFVTALLKKIKTSKDGMVNLFGSGKPLRQFIHTEDLAKIIVGCLERDIKTDFNVCCDESPSIMEIAQTALTATNNKHLRLAFDVSKPDGQFRKDCSNKKMRELFPHFKFLSLEEGLRRVYNSL
jgi:GDP-L-fucose synthase